MAVVLKRQQIEDSESARQNQECQNTSAWVCMTMKRDKTWISIKVRMKERM